MIHTDVLAAELGTPCTEIFEVSEIHRLVLDLVQGQRCEAHGCFVYSMDDQGAQTARSSVARRRTPAAVPHYEPTPEHLREGLDASEREEQRRWAALDDREEAR